MERAKEIIEIEAVETMWNWKIVCPFCGQEHRHGKGAGHRVAHCDDRKAHAVVLNGVEYRPQDGYILTEPKRVEAISGQ